MRAFLLIAVLCAVLLSARACHMNHGNNCTCVPTPKEGVWAFIKPEAVAHLDRHCRAVTMKSSLCTVPGPILLDSYLKDNYLYAKLIVGYRKNRCYDFRFCHPKSGVGFCSGYDDDCCRVDENNWRVLNVGPHTCNLTVIVRMSVRKLLSTSGRGCSFQPCHDCDYDSKYQRFHGHLQVTYIDRIVDSNYKCCKCRVIINRFRLCIKLPKKVFLCTPVITVEHSCPNVTVQAMLIRQELRFDGVYRPCGAFVLLEFCTIVDWPFKLKQCYHCWYVAPGVCACMYPDCSCCANCRDREGSACVQKWMVILFACHGHGNRAKSCYESAMPMRDMYRRDFCFCSLNCTNSSLCMYDVKLRLCFDLCCRGEADCTLCEIRRFYVCARIQTADFCGVATITGVISATMEAGKLLGVPAQFVVTALFKQNEMLWLRIIVSSPDVTVQSIKLWHLFVVPPFPVRFLVKNGEPTPLGIANDLTVLQNISGVMIVGFKVSTGGGPDDIFDLPLLTQRRYKICALLNITYMNVPGKRNEHLRLAFGGEDMEQEIDLDIQASPADEPAEAETEDEEEAGLLKNPMVLGGMGGALGMAAIAAGVVTMKKKKRRVAGEKKGEEKVTEMSEV